MIKCRNIRKSFGEITLFDDYSLTVEDGEFICIYGKSGCGKTTLLNMIGGLDLPDNGIVEYVYDSKNYNTMQNYRKIRSELVNYVFQNFALIQNETVENNLMLALKNVKISKIRKEEIIKTELENVELLSKYRNKVYELSGGEQQRIALVRAFIKPGNVLLADEPTGSLDEVNKDIVIELLKKYNAEGNTVIVVTHDEVFKDIATRVIKL